MNQKYKKTLILIINLFAIIIAIFVMLAFAHMEKYDSAYDIDKYSDFVHIERTQDNHIRYSMKITDDHEQAISLAIRTSFQTLHVYADDLLIYSLDVPSNQKFLDMPPSQWNIVPIPSEHKNSIVTLEYYSSYDRYQTYTPTVYIGRERDILVNLVGKTFNNVFLSWIIIIFAVASFFICFYLSKKSFIYMKYLSVFLLMYGLWTWGEGKSYFFNYAPLNIQTTITFYMVMLMPIPAMLYLRNNPNSLCMNKKIEHTIITVYLTATILDIVLGTLLYLLNVCDLIEYIILPLIFWVLGVIILLLFEIKSSIVKYKKTGFLYIAPLVILFISYFWEFFSFLRGHSFYTGIYSKFGVLVFVISIYAQELIERKQEEYQLEELERALLQANIHIMTTKMKPHFIHNTLLAIQELCYSDPKQAYTAIGLFSKYLRGNIEGVDQSALIPFTKELEFIDVYIDIQKMCYEDAITFDTEINFEAFSIPPFTIQPLVENAFSHGILKSRKKGSVTLRSWLDHDIVYIEIADNGVGYDLNKSQTDTFNSSDAVMYRVKHLLNGDIVVKSSINIGTKVLVSIPYIP